MDHGGRPEGCILEVGSNWCCGSEVPLLPRPTRLLGRKVQTSSLPLQKYCPTLGQAAKSCWSQADQCWNLAPQAMNNDCNMYLEYQMQEDLNSQCRNGNWCDPPNAGRGSHTYTHDHRSAATPRSNEKLLTRARRQYYKDTPQYQPAAARMYLMKETFCASARSRRRLS